MISQKYFCNYCNKLFDDACTFTSEQNEEMGVLIKCNFNGRLVAKLYVHKDLTTEADVYTPDQCLESTRFKWRFKHLLKKYTYVDRHKVDVIKEISSLVNSKFYAHSEDVWELINQITDDIFAIDVEGIAKRLMDKADLLRYGEIKWRFKTHEQELKDTIKPLKDGVAIEDSDAEADD